MACSILCSALPGRLNRIAPCLRSTACSSSNFMKQTAQTARLAQPAARPVAGPRFYVIEADGDILACAVKLGVRAPGRLKEAAWLVLGRGTAHNDGKGSSPHCQFEPYWIKTSAPCAAALTASVRPWRPTHCGTPGGRGNKPPRPPGSMARRSY